MSVISIPVAANDTQFEWELDLFWFAHRHIYGEQATSRSHAIFINKNGPDRERASVLPWENTVPHTVCYSAYDWQPAQELTGEGRRLVMPLNIQLGLLQIIDQFPDDQLLELLDCDMFHFRPYPEKDYDIPRNVLHVDAVYEDWHLKSLSDHKGVISRYFENNGQYYNGGFVPIVGRCSTFKRILPEWIAVHLDILKQPGHHKNIYWWAGMYALQAACEKAKVEMVAKESCYVPGANELKDTHYVGHYSVDKTFDKRKFPAIHPQTFENNPFYDIIRAWLKTRKETFG